MASLIFCERSGDWAAAWRRVAGGRPSTTIVETRSLAECRETLEALDRAGSAAGFLIVELHSANVDEALDLVWRVARRFPDVAVAVVAERELASYEELVRELGALHFATSPRRLGTLVRLGARHMARQPMPALDDRERVFASLPWSK
jgi:hypothetical protein